MEKENKKSKIMKPLIIIGIIIIPLIYSFFYLKAFWDPYANLENIPVAIVNNDKCNENENLGKNFVDNILEEKEMDFQLVDEDEANDGLINKRYYAIIEIPEDFTEKLNSGETENKQIAKITYSPNQKSNFLAAQIIDSAVTQIEEKIQEEVTGKVVDNLSDKLNDVPNQLETVEEAATKLEEGSKSLTEGVEKIDNGIGTLSKNYNDFNEGVSSVDKATSGLQNGIDSLNNGIDDLYDGSKTLTNSTKDLSKISEAASTLSEKENELNYGISQYVDGVNSATKQISTLLTNIIQYVQTNPEALNDPQFKAIYDNILSLAQSDSLSELNSSGNILKTNSNLMNESIKSLSSATEALPEVSSGIETIENGIYKIKAGAEELKEGSRELKDGTETLSSSSEEIKSGITELKRGTEDALEGSNILLDGQNEFVSEIGKSIDEARAELVKLNGISDYAKNAIEVEENVVEPVDSYGIGFAPYFMSLSLWIGGLMIFVGIYFDPHNRFKRIGRDAPNRAFRTFIYLLIAIAQAVILGGLLKVGLGFDVENNLLYYGSCILVSLAFLSIIQFLMVNFGDVGKFITILFLVIQLAACGGTFPMETLPQFYQDINSLMPMTYSLNLFKEAIIGTSPGFVQTDVNALLGIMIVFVVMTFAIDIIKMCGNKIIKAKKQA